MSAQQQQDLAVKGGLIVRLASYTGPNSPRFGATSTGTYELKCFSCEYKETWTETAGYLPLTGIPGCEKTSLDPQKCPKCGASNGTLHVVGDPAVPFD